MNLSDHLTLITWALIFQTLLLAVLCGLSFGCLVLLFIVSRKPHH